MGIGIGTTRDIYCERRLQLLRSTGTGRKGHISLSRQRCQRQCQLQYLGTWHDQSQLQCHHERPNWRGSNTSCYQWFASLSVPRETKLYRAHWMDGVIYSRRANAYSNLYIFWKLRENNVVLFAFYFCVVFSIQFNSIYLRLNNEK